MWTICWLCSWSRGWRGTIWICKFGNYCRGEEKLQWSIKILKCLKWKTCKKKPINLSFFTLFLWEKKTLMNLNYRRFNLNQILLLYFKIWIGESNLNLRCCTLYFCVPKVKCLVRISELKRQFTLLVWLYLSL